MKQGSCTTNKACAFSVLIRVKAAQNELGQQILADFEEAFPSQGTKVKFSFPLFLPMNMLLKTIQCNWHWFKSRFISRMGISVFQELF